MRFQFTDIVTSLNLVAGLLAIYAAMNGQTLAAIILILAAMVFDFFDGRIARLLKQEHALGRELDSLCDMVSFGIAPGIVLLVLHESIVILVAITLYAVAGAYRLARFNIEKHKEFRGLPIPAAAFLVLASTFAPLNVWAEAIVVLIIAILMVSTIPIKKP